MLFDFIKRFWFVNPETSLFNGGGGIVSSNYQISNSVRLRASASAYFSKTWGTSPTSRTTMTFSTWVKRSSPGTENIVFGTAGSYELCRFNTDDTLRVTGPYMAAQQGILVTAQPFRDSSAWLHIVVVYDTTNGTAGDRIRLYINGVRVTAFSTNTASNVNNTTTEWLVNAIGNRLGFVAANYFDGYFADTYVIDGQALTPSSFGQTDTNGVWVPKAYTGTYGNNGFHLDFKDANLTAGSNVGLGKDVSGNGNYWNTNSISVTAGVTYDSVVDTPTNNYATLNPIIASAANISYAALRSGTTAVQATEDAAAFTNSGAYWEVTAAGSAVTAGVISGTGTTNTTTVTANKVFGFRLVSGALSYINITDVGSWTSITTGLTGQQFPYGVTQAADWNFGQRPFSGTPSGQALCTANLPAVAIPKPAAQFDAKTRTGTGAAFNVTGEAFAPDFLWSKGRSGATDHVLSDRIRGTTKYLVSDSTAAEATDAQAVTAFNADGFSGGTMAALNTNAATYIDWMWKANGAGVSNTDGSITSTVSANQTAGFSIVTYTSPNNVSDQTVGHGLGVAPKFIIAKNRDSGVLSWDIWHTALSSGYGLTFTTAASTASRWPTTAPTTAVFSTKNTYEHQNTDRYVAYCFAEIPGYSKFGSYVGNAALDGTFVYCGFRPRCLIIKRYDAGTNSWYIYDAAREPDNTVDAELSPNTSGIETSGSSDFDFLSNGFKCRNTSTGSNNGSYIFAAFAEFPFGGSNVSPAPAR